MAAPTESKEGDVKVPIEDAEKKDAATEVEDQDVAMDEMDPEEEAARVEAAKRAGEAAAEEDFKAQAEKAESEMAGLAEQVEAAQQEAEAAKKRADEASERLVRLQADWENYRRRTAQERLDERQRAADAPGGTGNQHGSSVGSVLFFAHFIIFPVMVVVISIPIRKS